MLKIKAICFYCIFIIHDVIRSALSSKLFINIFIHNYTLREIVLSKKSLFNYRVPFIIYNIINRDNKSARCDDDHGQCKYSQLPQKYTNKQLSTCKFR